MSQLDLLSRDLNVDDNLVELLGTCDAYAVARAESSAALADLFWLLTVARRRSGGCSLGGTSDLRETFAATVRVHRVHVGGAYCWQVVRADEGGDPGASGSANANANANTCACLFSGVSSPALRKIAAEAAPAALQKLCALASLAQAVGGGSE